MTVPVKELEDAVSELNDLCYVQTEAMEPFLLTTDGDTQSVSFLSLPIWVSEEDERGYIDDDNTYEPIISFLRREAQKLVNTVGNLWLAETPRPPEKA